MAKTTGIAEGSKKFKFILFITGMSGKSINAVENLKKICDKHLAEDFELDIIDISIEKHYAGEYQIIAVPTLIRVDPKPPRIILGDLSDTEKVLKVLNLN